METKKPKRMTVMAKGAAEGKPAGFYGQHLRQNGDVFDLVEREDREGKTISVDRQFSSKWMEKVEKQAKSVSK